MKGSIVYAKDALKDARKLAAAGLKPKPLPLLELLAGDPFQSPPPSEKSSSETSKGSCSRRINIQHRLVYEVFKKGTHGPCAANGYDYE